MKLEEYGLTEVRKKVSLTKLMDVIKNDCIIEDEDELVKNLKGFFKSKLFDDRDRFTKKNLSSLLSANNIRLDYEASDWEDAIRIAGNVLIENGSVTEEYIEDMIKAVKKNGSYMVVAEIIALPHARVTKSVLKTDMSLIRLKNPVVFPGNKSVKIIFPFSSVDQNEHIEALSELVTLIEDYDLIKVIENLENPEQLKNFIKNSKI
jgi:mannitol/fructose-specific phosphotransferase system IIA component (Ntr-type)